MATCNINDLLAEPGAACFACAEPNLQRAAIIQLLCDISASAGGGVTSIIAGSGITVDQATGDVTVTYAGPAAAGTLTGTTLPANVVTSSLTSVGTLATLTVTATITGAVSGNAGTATVLQTARNINGVSFNGSANITVVDSAALPKAGGTMTGAVDFGAQKLYGFTSSEVTKSANYTMTSAEVGKIIKSTGSAMNLTFDTNFPDFGSATVIQSGAGQVTIVVSGLTIRNFSSFTKTAGQYATIQLYRSGTDLFLMGQGA